MSGSTEKRSLQVSPSVKSAETPDGIVLLDVHGGMCFPLDPVGTFIWKHLEQQLEIDTIARDIASTYHIPIQQASADLNEFIQQLQARNLLLDGKNNGHSKTLPLATALGQLCKRLVRRRNIARGV